MKKIQLNLGCGIQVKKGFINVDNFFTLEDLKAKKGAFVDAVVEKGGTFVKADLCKLPFPNDYADYIECMETIEHIPFRSLIAALEEMRRVLKPGKKLCISAPDFDYLATKWATDMAYQEWGHQIYAARYADLTEYIFGNQAGPWEVHRTPLNPPALKNYMLCAKWKPEDFSIRVIKAGGTESPPTKTLKWPKGVPPLYDMLWLEAIKQALDKCIVLV